MHDTRVVMSKSQRGARVVLADDVVLLDFDAYDRVLCRCWGGFLDHPINILGVCVLVY